MKYKPYLECMPSQGMTMFPLFLYEKFEICFINLGMESLLSSSLLSTLEEFVSMLYGTKLKSVNEARYAIFEKKRQKENKIIDMAALPPCESVLHLYSKRANAVAYMCQNAVNPNVGFPSSEDSSWYLNVISNG